MKLYRIKNWDEIFENNRSRTVKDLSWVAVPNRHDGENFSAIMLHKQGAEIFAAWILMLQVASRCQPRGSLVRDNGKPHSAASLSVKTRAPQKWFEIALDFLEKETDWIDFQILAPTYQDGDRTPSAACQSGDEGRKEGLKGMEVQPLLSPSVEGDGSKPSKGPLQLRAEALMKRRPETPLTAGEERAFKNNREAIKATTEEDWKLLEEFYAAPQTETFSRKDLATLLNNWNGEIDRARAWKAKKPNDTPGEGDF